MAIKKSILNLKQFMLRQEVLALYRNILKTVREVPNEDDRKNLLEWVRKDFKNNKNEADEYAINSYIKNGEKFLNELKQSLKLSS